MSHTSRLGLALYPYTLRRRSTVRLGLVRDPEERRGVGSGVWESGVGQRRRGTGDVETLGIGVGRLSVGGRLSIGGGARYSRVLSWSWLSLLTLVDDVDSWVTVPLMAWSPNSGYARTPLASTQC
ncbi:hypothetical protein GGX14DRAFT_401668 [Mycena pura]|uniref:Uncharacterized protein n=1 Tax=Mycena pura TaxID=153505 RepID=A0AAD6V0L9_9AGAR|nr:hypothetical protein GGX14DRAFT_401668 [Mycena pura]